MSKVIEARAILEQAKSLSSEIDVVNLIEQALGMLYREKYAERTENKSDPMNRAKVLEIKLLLSRHPDWSHQEVANAAHVNPGRITEVIAGDWDYLLPI